MIKKNTEEISDVLFSVAMFMVIFTLMLIAILIVGVMVYGLTHPIDYSCAYCRGTIAKNIDYVCMAGGRRMHAECYLRYIEEGKNGKANSETP